MADTDVEIAGARLSTVGRAATAPTPADAHEQAAKALYRDTPKAEPSDPGTMYSSAGLYRDAFNESLPKLGDAGVLTYDQQEAERKAFPDMIRKSGLNPSVGLRLHQLYTQRRLEVLDDETRATRTADLEEATHKALRENYALRGIKGKDFEALKGRVTRWMAKNPDLRAVVTFAGIGNELGIAQELYELVQMNGLGFEK